MGSLARHSPTNMSQGNNYCRWFFGVLAHGNYKNFEELSPSMSSIFNYYKYLYINGGKHPYPERGEGRKVSS